MPAVQAELIKTITPNASLLTPQHLQYINQIISLQDQRYAQMLSRVNLPDQGSRERLMEKRMRFSERLRELFSEQFGIQELIDKVYIPLYDKYFTENELNDLLSFYRSPTGEKTLEVTPRLFQESMEKSQRILAPKIDEIVRQIMGEEQKIEGLQGRQSSPQDNTTIDKTDDPDMPTSLGGNKQSFDQQGQD